MKDKIKNNINNIKEVIRIRANYELMDIDYIDKEGERKTITDGDENDVLYYIQHLQEEIERLHSIIKEVREKINNFDVFKEFTFPLMKRDVENQVKSSIDYEWRKSIKEPILEILDKENNND